MRAAATIYELLLGLALLLAPWSALWRESLYLGSALSLSTWIQSGVVRGAVSGLGAAFLLAASARILDIDLLEDEPLGRRRGSPR